MRILHIIDTLWLGGAQTLLKSIFEYQAENENIFLFSLRKTDPQISIEHQHITFFDSENKFCLRRIKTLKHFIKENKIDVLHCHLPHAQAMGYIMKRFYFKKIILVFHEHAEVFNDGWTIKYLLKSSKKKVDKYITCSKSSKVELVDKIRIDPYRVLVQHNFTDTDKFNKRNYNFNISEERKTLGIKPDDFVVGFAGRLVERKGWKELLYAASELKSNENMKFLVAGIGPDQQEFDSTIDKLGLKNKIVHLGYFENMPLFYSLINCLAIPSYWEGMSIVQLEAAAMEVPMVCTDAPGLIDIFENFKDTLYFELGNHKDLKGTIEKIISDKELREDMVKNSLLKVKKFNITNYLEELDNTYKMIIQNEFVS